MPFHTTARIAACALLAIALSAHAEEGCVPVPLTAPASGEDLCYGKAAWKEPTLGNQWLKQQFDFQRATSGAKRAPLIIWAHPNGTTKTLRPGTPIFHALVPPALQAGFAFASIEFRHPVTNEGSNPDTPVPHLDIARAIQFIRANAEALGVDKRNIFIVAQSRGSLGVWTALQDDMADPDGTVVQKQSTRVSAVFAFNAQTTYDGREFADLFIVPRDRPDFVADFATDHPKYLQFQSAIRSVSGGQLPDPPVFLRHDAPLVPGQLTLEQMEQQDAEHYPNFGKALCDAYDLVFGVGQRCWYQADSRFAGNPRAAFAGYVSFFQRYLQP